MALSAGSFPDPGEIRVIGKKIMVLESVNGHRSKFQWDSKPTDLRDREWLVIKRSKKTTWHCNSHNFPTVSYSQEIASTLACASFVGLVEAQN